MQDSAEKEFDQIKESLALLNDDQIVEESSMATKSAQFDLFVENLI